jgi:hypothetical protein
LEIQAPIPCWGNPNKKGNRKRGERKGKGDGKKERRKEERNYYCIAVSFVYFVCAAAEACNLLSIADDRD